MTMKVSKKKSKPKTRKLVKATLILIVAFVILFLAAGGSGSYAFFYYKTNLKPVNSAANSIIYVIEPGDTIKTLGKRLEKDGLIRNANVFELAARINNKTALASGAYEISAAMTTGEILTVLTNSKNAIHDTIVVTLREGWWAKDIAKAISEKCNISSDALLNLWHDPEFINSLSNDYWFISSDIIEEGERVYLEGYLYPDTYEFYRDSSAEEITRRLLNRFGELVEPLRPAIEANKMSLDEIVTLASIVQFESGNYQDMPIIAGVFMNRLNQGMKLQSSVTICYTIYNYTDSRECELAKNREIKSPYNTYMYNGLPLGPILNPTIKAIEAVINYQKTDYMYFIGKDGITYYAKTLAEHEANIDKYLR